MKIIEVGDDIKLKHHPRCHPMEPGMNADYSDRVLTCRAWHRGQSTTDSVVSVSRRGQTVYGGASVNCLPLPLLASILLHRAPTQDGVLTHRPRRRGRPRTSGGADQRRIRMSVRLSCTSIASVCAGLYLILVLAGPTLAEHWSRLCVCTQTRHGAAVSQQTRKALPS